MTCRTSRFGSVWLDEIFVLAKAVLLKFGMCGTLGVYFIMVSVLSSKTYCTHTHTHTHTKWLLWASQSCLQHAQKMWNRYWRQFLYLLFSVFIVCGCLFFCCVCFLLLFVIVVLCVFCFVCCCWVLCVCLCVFGWWRKSVKSWVQIYDFFIYEVL